MKRPLISIIIPVRNEAAYIERCLESIYAQDFASHQYEVIVVDGRSTDGTLAKIQNLKSRYPNLKIVENPKKTVSSGVNLGIRNSTGDIVFRMDAHAEYGKDYIKTCLEVMEQTGADNVGGPAIPLPGADSDMAGAIAAAHLSPFGLGGGLFRNPWAEGFAETVWPGCFRRSVFDRVGFLDERLTRTEDIEFNTRLRRAGFKIFLSPRIKAYYYCRPNLKQLWVQRWLDGKGVIQTLAVNPRALQIRHLVPLFFVLGLMSPIRVDIRGKMFWTNVFVWPVIYLLAMTYFTFKAQKYHIPAAPDRNDLNISDTTSQGRWLWRLPLVFATLHFSYGLGSLWALVTWPWWWFEFRRKKGSR